MATRKKHALRRRGRQHGSTIGERQVAKISASYPGELADAITDAARSEGITRSAWLQRAARHELDRTR